MVQCTSYPGSFFSIGRGNREPQLGRGTDLITFGRPGPSENRGWTGLSRRRHTWEVVRKRRIELTLIYKRWGPDGVQEIETTGPRYLSRIVRGETPRYMDRTTSLRLPWPLYPCSLLQNQVFKTRSGSLTSTTHYNRTESKLDPK